LQVFNELFTVDETIRLSPISAVSGSFGKREAVAEEQYFRKLEKEKTEHYRNLKL
jgi:hypothetical protein